MGGRAIRLAPQSDAANANARQLVQPIRLDFKKPDASKILNKMGLQRDSNPNLQNRG